MMNCGWTGKIVNGAIAQVTFCSTLGLLLLLGVPFRIAWRVRLAVHFSGRNQTRLIQGEALNVSSASVRQMELAAEGLKGEAGGPSVAVMLSRMKGGMQALAATGDPPPGIAIDSRL